MAGAREDQQSNIDASIDELLEAVSEIDEQLLSKWYKHLTDGSKSEEAKAEAREKTKTMLKQYKEGALGNNFIETLVQFNSGEEDEQSSKGRLGVKLAINFVHAMKVNPHWSDIWEPVLETTMEHCESIASSVISEALSVTSPRTVTTERDLWETVRLDDIDKVEKFTPEEVRSVDKNKLTLMHHAALAIVPNATVAGALIEKMKADGGLINRRSNKHNGWNTALHVAAGNPRVNHEFIEKFKDADPTLLNCDLETPFHIAARSKNPKIILYMLNTFEPTNSGWDIDYVDILKELHDSDARQKMFPVAIVEKLLGEEIDMSQIHMHNRHKNRLINICARSGNNEAVALLIKHGADISKGVLHEIVLESVENPEKIDQLKAVYQAIVDNAVTWRCLEEGNKTQLKMSDDYKTMLKETMTWLLRHPLPEYEDKDVLEFAIKHGASKMFKLIINTKGVMRMDEKNGNVKFTVTNFTRMTMNEKRNHPTTNLVVGVREQSNETGNEDGLQMLGSEGNNNDTIGPKDKEGIRKNTVRQFDKPSVPDKPYLTYFLSFFDQWQHTQILSARPLKELTNISFVFIELMYFLLGSLQMVYMICFSTFYTPTVSSIIFSNEHDTINRGTDINGTTSGKSDVNRMASIHEGSWPSGFWLVWPILLLVGSTLWSIFTFKHSKRLSKWIRCFTLLTESMIVRSFCIVVFVWFHLHHSSTTRALPVGAAAVLQIFGWLTTVEYFGGISKNINISMVLVKKIIRKDIPGFMLFFGFTVLGFSFAMHALRMLACELDESMTILDSFYGVFSIAFGIGGFFDDVVANSSCNEEAKHLFKIVYFAYVAVSLIILLNLLIAMMSNRYAINKESAEDIWRHQNLSLMRALAFYYEKVRGKKTHWLWEAARKTWSNLPLFNVPELDTDNNYYLTIAGHGDKE